MRGGKDTIVDVNTIYFEDFNIHQIGIIFDTIKTGYEVPPQIYVQEALVYNIELVFWLFVLLSFLVGMFNFLPSDPLDGGRMAKIMLAPYFSFLGFNKIETQLFIGRLFAWLFVLSIALNLLPYFTMIGL